MKERARWVDPVIFGALLLGAWEAAVVISGVSSLIVPLFSKVMVTMVFDAPDFVEHFLMTALEVIIGYFFAVLFGSAFGTLVALSPFVGAAVFPNLIAAQVMPKVAFAPLLVLWLGFGMAPKVVLCTLIAFFPIVINTIVGLNQTQREAIYLFRSMGANSVQIFFKLRLPNSLPIFFGGLKVSATLAVIGAVVGEFTGADIGLGALLTVQVGTAETAGAFASIIYLTLLGLIVYAMVILAERMIIPAHMLDREGEYHGDD